MAECAALMAAIACWISARVKGDSVRVWKADNANGWMLAGRLAIAFGIGKPFLVGEFRMAFPQLGLQALFFIFRKIIADSLVSRGARD